MAYITPQASAVVPSGIRKKKRPSYLDAIQSQYGLATQSVIAEKNRQLEEKMAAEKLDIQKASLAQEKSEAKTALGLNIASLGTNIASSLGKKSLGSLAGKTVGSKLPQWASNLSVGGTVGGAVAGYGLSNVIKKDPSWLEQAGLTIGGGLLGGWLV